MTQDDNTVPGLDGTILVTGAGGFVGRHLLAALSGEFTLQGPRIAVGRAGTAQLARLEQPWIAAYCDLTDDADVDALIREHKPAVIVHLAAQASIAGAFADGAAETWRTNFLSTLNLARSVARHVPGSTFLFSSSADVYGRAFLDGRVNETSLPVPQNSYARSKIACEQLLADILPTDSRLIITRPTNHSGKGQDPGYVLPNFAAQVVAIERGTAPPVLKVGNLQVERDIIHVQDVVHAIVDLLKMTDDLPSRATFNICSGRPVLLSKVVDDLISMSGCAIEVEPDPDRFRPVDIPRAEASPAALQEVIGWAPPSDITAILRDVLDDQRSNAA
ncbi:MAG: NAD-dependent epimerase/dehydratase family protein [Roseibium sp.]|nr:NAD-dependent epimerase/dehydratase family protein [Roseibium sp.]